MGLIWKLDAFIQLAKGFWTLDLHSNFCSFCSSSADNTVHMFDRRKLNSRGVGSPVYKFEGHDAAVLCVQVAGRSCLASNNYSSKLNVQFSYGHFSSLIINSQFWSVSVVSWQIICIWKLCWRRHFKHLGHWQGLNSKIFKSLTFFVLPHLPFYKNVKTNCI